MPDQRPSCPSCGATNGMRPYVTCTDDYHKAQFDGEDGFVPLGWVAQSFTEQYGGYIRQPETEKE